MLEFILILWYDGNDSRASIRPNNYNAQGSSAPHIWGLPDDAQVTYIIENFSREQNVYIEEQLVEFDDNSDSIVRE